MITTKHDKIKYKIKQKLSHGVWTKLNKKERALRASTRIKGTLSLKFFSKYLAPGIKYSWDQDPNRSSQCTSSSGHSLSLYDQEKADSVASLRHASLHSSADNNQHKARVCSVCAQNIGMNLIGLLSLVTSSELLDLSESQLP